MRILVFGDSIAYGAWGLSGGWVDVLKRFAHKTTISSNGETKLQILNLGIGGDTSQKILNRMDSEIKAREHRVWPSALIFAYGTNDERKVEGQQEVSLEDFTENTLQIINKAKTYTNRILFVGPPPLAKDIVEFKGIEYSNERILEYENKLKEVVVSNNIAFVPVRAKFENNNDLFVYDGVHLSDAGHHLIADEVKLTIESWINN